MLFNITNCSGGPQYKFLHMTSQQASAANYSAQCICLHRNPYFVAVKSVAK